MGKLCMAKCILRTHIRIASVRGAAASGAPLGHGVEAQNYSYFLASQCVLLLLPANISFSAGDVAAKLVLAFAEHSAMVSLFLVARVHRIKCLYAWRSELGLLCKTHKAA